jgi:hypothetical protein
MERGWGVVNKKGREWGEVNDKDLEVILWVDTASLRDNPKNGKYH